MARPIDNGTVEIVDVQRAAVVGYCFTENGTNPQAQQVQRWVLYPEYQAPPVYTVLLRRPQSSTRHYTRFEEWSLALQKGGLWRAGSKYVKVNCVSYNEIVSTSNPDADQQLDDGATSLFQGGWVGSVFTTPRVDGINEEHWVLFDAYRSPPGAPVKAGKPAAEQGAPTLRLFLEKMKSGWQKGNTYVVGTCTSFSALPGPTDR